MIEVPHALHSVMCMVLTMYKTDSSPPSILDLRKCEYKGADLRAKVLAGALMSDADFTGANMQEAVLTKVMP